MMMLAGLLCIAAVAVGLIAGDIAMVGAVLHGHHTTAGVLGAVAGAFALDALVVAFVACFAELAVGA